MGTPLGWAEDVLAVVADAFEVPPGRQVVTLGRPSTRGCGCDDETPGMVGVGVLRRFPTSDPWPAQAFTSERCGAGVAAELVVVHSRCAPLIDEVAAPPPADVLNAAHAEALRDAERIWHALSCALPAWRQLGEVALGGQSMIGQQARCVGSETTLYVHLADCDDCDCPGGGGC